MSKELEAFNEIIDKFAEQMMRANKEALTAINKTNAIEYLYRTPQVRLLQQALQRLESIDNAIEICKKANEQNFVYIKESYGIVKEKFLDDLDYEVINNRLYVNSRGMYYDFPLKDYGNWWALTKEELEND